MRNLLLISFASISLLTAQAQTDSVRLVDIQSSECGGMYRVKPGFIRKETIGDTTFMSLFCSNNCAGYHDPSVSLSGDSVLIHFGYGKRVTRFKLLNGEYIDEEEINLHSKDSILEEVTEAIATCDCCYTFELKVLGLDAAANYNYFYNERYIDPNYKATGFIQVYEFPYFFKQTKSEIEENVMQILLATKALSNATQSDYMLVKLTVDTISGTVKHVRTSLDTFKTDKRFNRKLKRYFFSISPIICIRTKFKPSMIREYWVGLEFNAETKELEMTYENGEPLSHD